MYPIKQSTALTVPFFSHDENGDAVTGMVDGGFTKTISKNGGALGAMTVTITEMASGWYSFPLSDSHSNTLGLLTIVFTNASCKQVNLQFRVHARLPDDLAQPGDSMDLVANAVDNTSVATGAIGTDEFTQGAADKVWDTVARILTANTNFNDPTANTIRDAILSDSTPFDGADIALILGDTNEMQGKLPSGSISDFDETADPVELLDSGGTAGTSAAELVTDMAVPTAADNADAVWDEAATGHIDAGKAGQQLWTDVDAILTDTEYIQPRVPAAGTLAVSGDAMDLIADAVDTSTFADATLIAQKFGGDFLTSAKIADNAFAPEHFAASALHATIASNGFITDVAAGIWGALRATYQDADTFGEHVLADVIEISGSATAADNLENSALCIVSGLAQTGTLEVDEMTTDLTEATDDHYNGRIIVFRGGVLDGQATDITDYDGASKLLTFTALTEAPLNNQAFTIV